MKKNYFILFLHNLNEFHLNYYIKSFSQATETKTTTKLQNSN